MKSPPRQFTDHEARERTEAFIAGVEDTSRTSSNGHSTVPLRPNPLADPVESEPSIEP
jgi:hypothetical protein